MRVLGAAQSGGPGGCAGWGRSWHRMHVQLAWKLGSADATVCGPVLLLAVVPGCVLGCWVLGSRAARTSCIP
jgi:hypothetical protein